MVWRFKYRPDTVSIVRFLPLFLNPVSNMIQNSGYGTGSREYATLRRDGIDVATRRDAVQQCGDSIRNSRQFQGILGEISRRFRDRTVIRPGNPWLHVKESM
jgi:hypothetical protein